MEELPMEEKCHCLFCETKCPSCGSENIRAGVSPHYRMVKDKGKIFLYFNGVDTLDLKCKDCGKQFDLTEEATQEQAIKGEAFLDPFSEVPVIIAELDLNSHTIKYSISKAFDPIRDYQNEKF